MAAYTNPFILIVCTFISAGGLGMIYALLVLLANYKSPGGDVHALLRRWALGIAFTGAVVAYAAAAPAAPSDAVAVDSPGFATASAATDPGATSFATDPPSAPATDLPVPTATPLPEPSSGTITDHDICATRQAGDDAFAEAERVSMHTLGLAEFDREYQHAPLTRAVLDSYIGGGPSSNIFQFCYEPGGPGQ